MKNVKSKKIASIGTMRVVGEGTEVREILTDGVADGILTFRLYAKPIGGSEQVFGNGLLLEPEGDYTLVEDILRLLPILNSHGVAITLGWQTLTVRYKFLIGGVNKGLKICELFVGGKRYIEDNDCGYARPLDNDWDFIKFAREKGGK